MWDVRTGFHGVGGASEVANPTSRPRGLFWCQWAVCGIVVWFKGDFGRKTSAPAPTATMSLGVMPLDVHDLEDGNILRRRLFGGVVKSFGEVVTLWRLGVDPF